MCLNDLWRWAARTARHASGVGDCRACPMYQPPPSGPSPAHGESTDLIWWRLVASSSAYVAVLTRVSVPPPLMLYASRRLQVRGQKCWLNQVLERRVWRGPCSWCAEDVLLRHQRHCSIWCCRLRFRLVHACATCMHRKPIVLSNVTTSALPPTTQLHVYMYVLVLAWCIITRDVR